MHHRRLTPGQCLGLTALAVAVSLIGACTFPGLRVDEGGAEVWAADRAAYDQSNNHGQGVEVVDITPELIVRLGHQRRQAAQELKQYASTVSPVKTRLRDEYRVGAGDVLSVVVWDHPELTNPAGEARDPASSGQVVRADGSFFYPHVGVIKVAGLTVEEIRSRIATGLARTVIEPQVDVRVREFRSQHTYIVGDVERPCRLPITDQQLTVFDALDACATIRPAKTHRRVTLQRAGQDHLLDLNQLYRNPAAVQALALRHGDQLYVEDGRWNRVFVVGELKSQAALDIPVSGLTLAEAINDEQVGGLSQDTSSGALFVIRGVPLELVPGADTLPTGSRPPKIYRLDAKSVDALVLADQFRLQPRDVVFASSASMVSYNRAVVQLLPSLQTLLQAYIVFDDE